MTTFNQATKDALLAEIKKHQEADQIIQGTYGGIDPDGIWKGCAVGCSVHSLNILNGTHYETDNHHVYEDMLGIPEAIAYLEDGLFEGMPTKKAISWPYRFIQAVPTGVDLSLVLPKFYIRILTDTKYGVRQYASEDDKQAIDMVVSVHKNHISTGEVDEYARRAAWSAADNASVRAMGAYSAARSDASAATYSAMSAAARSAASSAAYSAVKSVLQRDHYTWMAEQLIDILEHTT